MDHFHFHQLSNKLDEHHRLLTHIVKNQEKIMSAVSDYAAANKTAFANIATGLDGVEADIKTLADKLAQIDTNPGPITSADQALLDEALALATATATRISAIDAKNPPPPPATV